MTYFSCFMTVCAYEILSSFLSLHLLTLGFEEAQMGYWFSVASLLYLPACLAIPFVFKTTPPRAQIVGAFVLITIGQALMGPANYPVDSWLMIAGGLTLMGATTAPAFVHTLPEINLQCQLRHKIVEGTDLELEGKFSDVQTSLFMLA